MSDHVTKQPLAPPGEANASPPLRVAMLIGPQGAAGAAELLRQTPGIQIVEASSLWVLLELVRGGTVAAVVADPEQGEGWPVSAAEKIVSQVQDHVPVVLVCRDGGDVRLLEQRIGGAGVRVALLAALDPQLLSAIVSGVIAAHRTRPITEHS